MRKLCLLALLASPVVLAESSVSVDANSLLKLPARVGSLSLDRVVVNDYGTLVIPASVTELRIGELLMGRDARIGIAPSDQPFSLVVRRGEIGTGGHITASGAAGSMKKPASAGRDLSLRLEQVRVDEITLDVRGGIGTPGYSGLAGADGDSGGCLWGSASRGHDGQNGGDGQAGGAGGHIRLEVPVDFPVEQVKVRLEGGAGGPAGEAGAAGAGGAAKGCLFYRTEAGSKGRPGQPGQPGSAGAAGQLDVVRIQ
ncbi:hypothetical protein PHLH8_13800 [Pseudomonas sp. Pc102]|uniref:collagen-like protein n=1 Tax=Pseudomonas sp. Pc102 TaxID=2678261 RepID=UPI001BCADBB3|nr:collagen-like protein [Pseudomonas sp. Pc102]BBP81738.1 hypothetical protein PHLH8_13800 [Pseudomonas sp. Pc102]